MKTRPTYISGSARVPFFKSMTKYIDVTTQNLMIASLEALVKKMKLEGRILGDIGLGALCIASNFFARDLRNMIGKSLLVSTPPAIPASI